MSVPLSGPDTPIVSHAGADAHMRLIQMTASLMDFMRVNRRLKCI